MCLNSLLILAVQDNITNIHTCVSGYNKIFAHTSYSCWCTSLLACIIYVSPVLFWSASTIPLLYCIPKRLLSGFQQPKTWARRCFGFIHKILIKLSICTAMGCFEASEKLISLNSPKIGSSACRLLLVLARLILRWSGSMGACANLPPPGFCVLLV